MKLLLAGMTMCAGIFSVTSLAAETQRAVEGQSTHCQLGESVRVIAVVYPQGGELPCEVQYTKDGATSVLWQASSDAGYCEQQAADFVEKQRGWGFECVVMPAASKAADHDIID